MKNIEQFNQTTILTIGHSNHAVEKFIALIKGNHIDVVVDVRSKPYSRFASQFNKSVIDDSLYANGIRYLFLGDKIGGKPDNPIFYDTEGHLIYSRIAESPAFHEGIERLIKGSGQYRLALMCSEENPLNCHRYHLISKDIEASGIAVVHIRGDGRLQSNDELSRENEAVDQKEKQLSLFS
jgi:uncharacterized protein (DUF488 family)